MAACARAAGRPRAVAPADDTRGAAACRAAADTDRPSAATRAAACGPVATATAAGRPLAPAAAALDTVDAGRSADRRGAASARADVRLTFRSGPPLRRPRDAPLSG